jgi:hypothetical protein
MSAARIRVRKLVVMCLAIDTAKSAKLRQKNAQATATNASLICPDW